MCGAIEGREIDQRVVVIQHNTRVGQHSQGFTSVEITKKFNCVTAAAVEGAGQVCSNGDGIVLLTCFIGCAVLG